MTPVTPDPLIDPDDLKLVTLARGARGRIGAAEGAAVRDELGRTYSGASVQVGGLSLTALELAVAQAVASGASGLEAAVVVTAAVDEVDAASAWAVSRGAPVHVRSVDGSHAKTLRAT